jgi:hypothetical protein
VDKTSVAERYKSCGIAGLHDAHHLDCSIELQPSTAFAVFFDENEVTLGSRTSNASEGFKHQ